MTNNYKKPDFSLVEIEKCQPVCQSASQSSSGSIDAITNNINGEITDWTIE